MSWVTGACGALGGQKSIQPCMSAGVEEAEQWDEEEYNLFVGFCQDVKISKKSKEAEALHELCFSKGTAFQ